MVRGRNKAHLQNNHECLIAPQGLFPIKTTDVVVVVVDGDRQLRAGSPDLVHPSLEPHCRYSAARDRRERQIDDSDS